SILLFPCSVVVLFGRLLTQGRHAAVLYGVMLALFVGMTSWVLVLDAGRPNPALLARQKWVKARDGMELPALAGLPVDQSGTGNLEGKELRFGPGGAATFVAATPAVR